MRHDLFSGSGFAGDEDFGVRCARGGNCGAEYANGVTGPNERWSRVSHLCVQDPGERGAEGRPSRPVTDWTPLVRCAAAFSLTGGNRGGVHRARPDRDDSQARGRHAEGGEHAVFPTAGSRWCLRIHFESDRPDSSPVCLSGSAHR